MSRKSKFSGCDEISTKMLKLSSPYISLPFNYIYNKVLAMGVYTDRLKYAIIKAVYEYVNKYDVSNLRLLSLFKFLENVMQSRISRHLTKHNSTEQNTRMYPKVPGQYL